jgi:hypothetical protein
MCTLTLTKTSTECSSICILTLHKKMCILILQKTSTECDDYKRVEYILVKKKEHTTQDKGPGD